MLFYILTLPPLSIFYISNLGLLRTPDVLPILPILNAVGIISGQVALMISITINS